MQIMRKGKLRQTPKQKLVSILADTKELVLRSKYHGWLDVNPEEVAHEIDDLISHILQPSQFPLPEFTLALFAPTGPIQEVAIANRWHDAYMILSEEFDNLVYLIFLK